MKDLIERLEAAPEGSREMDVEIAHELGWVVPRRMRYDGDCIMVRGNTETAPLLYYTTSLDAAITLIPEGLQWALDKNEDDTFSVLFCDEEGTRGTMDGAPILPLAICIAALKAQQ